MLVGWPPPSINFFERLGLWIELLIVLPASGPEVAPVVTTTSASAKILVTIALTILVTVSLVTLVTSTSVTFLIKLFSPLSLRMKTLWTLQTLSLKHDLIS